MGRRMPAHPSRARPAALHASNRSHRSTTAATTKSHLSYPGHRLAATTADAAAGAPYVAAASSNCVTPTSIPITAASHRAGAAAAAAAGVSIAPTAGPGGTEPNGVLMSLDNLRADWRMVASELISV